MLNDFEEAFRHDTRHPASLVTVLVHAGDFHPATVDSLLDGLQDLAISSDHPQVRVAALSLLAVVGRPAAVTKPIPGVVRRLETIHESAGSVHVRRAALHRLGSQSEQEEAARVLRRIAMQDSARQRAPDAAHDAVWGLTHLDGPGSDALRELHERGLVSDLRARDALQKVAVQRGWHPSANDNR